MFPLVKVTTIDIEREKIKINHNKMTKNTKNITHALKIMKI